MNKQHKYYYRLRIYWSRDSPIFTILPRFDISNFFGLTDFGHNPEAVALQTITFGSVIKS